MISLDDIASLLSSISPEEMEKIKSIASSLMPPQSQSDDFSAQMPDKLSDNAPGAQLPKNVAAILQSFNFSDDKTQLIRSLKPFLSPERQQRADEAMRLLKLMKILPLIGQLNINDLPV